MTNMKNRVIDCMKGSVRAKLTYQDRHGQTVNREVEPYSISADGMTLFGFCIKDLTIKQFKFERMLEVEAGEAFVPRQEIKVPEGA